MTTYVDTYQGQIKEAKALFGETLIPQPGRTDAFYPNLSQTYAKRLLSFWVAEVNAALDAMGAIPDSAVVDQWVRAEHDRLKPLDVRMQQVSDGNALVPEKLAQIIWDVLDDVVLPMQALKSTPKKWEIAVEAIKDSLKDLGQGAKAGLSLFAKVALGIGGAWVGYEIFIKDRD